jgi:hypothetical protein
MARTTGEYLYDWWQTLVKDYRRFRRAALGRIGTIPMDVSGLATYVRARQFTGDIAYGVFVIAIVIAALTLTLL